MRTSLGQNFLNDHEIAEKIVFSANLSQNDNVLEIGPGKGILTKYLVTIAGKVLCVEIDKNLENTLKEVFNNSKNTKIIYNDILKINLPQLIEKNNFQNYKVIANLPYYITSKIIRLLLETKYPPNEMTLMVQKEVGERIVALDKKESILSISVKFYAEPKILFDVTREKFDPTPKVDSAVIKIKRRRNIPEADTKKFFSLVKAGFSSKRKMLVNNLSSCFGISKENISETLKKVGLDSTVRAEKLQLEDWLNLYNKIKIEK